MKDTPEDTARRQRLFAELIKLSEEAGMYDDEPTVEEVVATAKQVRKEMANEERRGLNPSYMAFDEDKGEKE